VLSGFATTDLSVRFRDACQGGEAYGKTPSMAWPSRFASFWCFLYVYCQPYLFLRMLRPLAADK
ncbi:hypothetical protein WCE03_26040, partial [Pseudomonas guariconensis]|uniref:hypothetical protein n=1 Tax=Pseudomonas guariconensis TaxID=1288410 RepID=UPI0034D7022F